MKFMVVCKKSRWFQEGNDFEDVIEDLINHEDIPSTITSCLTNVSVRISKKIIISKNKQGITNICVNGITESANH